MGKHLVFIDPGHGGRDPGAIGNGLREKDLTLSIALKVGEVLKSHGLQIQYSRTTDAYMGLEERAKLANRSNAGIFVSIHINSAKNTLARGVETYHYPGSVKGRELATAIQNSLVASKVFSHNRKVKTANHAVTRLTKMPACLTELGFIVNSQDAQLLKTKQLEIAQAIARGILNYLGMAYKEEQNTTSKDQPSAWAKEAWEWGWKNKIVDGTRPKDGATREELITMLYKYHANVNYPRL